MAATVEMRMANMAAVAAAAATNGAIGRWVTSAEAAAQLEISPRTLSRRIGARQLRTRRDGGRLLVWLPDGGHEPRLRDPVPVNAERTAARDAAPGSHDSHAAASVAELAATVGQTVTALERAMDRAAN